MSFTDDPPWVSSDEYMDDHYYVQVTATTDTPEKALKVLAEHSDDVLYLHGEHAENTWHPEKAKLNGITVFLKEEQFGTDTAMVPIWFWIRNDKADAHWSFNLDEALVSR